MGAVLKRVLKQNQELTPPDTETGQGDWHDLSGLLLPGTEEDRVVKDIKDGSLDTIDKVLDRFKDINDHYRQYQWAWTYRLILDYYQLQELTPENVANIRQDYVKARRAWIAEIRKDAEKEYKMGDVEPEVLDNFISQLDHEVDFEN